MCRHPGIGDTESCSRCPCGGYGIEVDVVSGSADRRADRGVDGAVGELGGPKGGGERLRQQWRHDAFMRSITRHEPAQLAVVAKAAACLVDGGDNSFHRGRGRTQAVRVGDQDVHRCPKSSASMRGQGHEPPLTVLADDELPALTDPVESEDDPLVDEEALGDGVAVVVVDDVIDDVAVVDVDFPASL